MKLFKKITSPKKVKSFLYVFIVFFFMNNLILLGSENKSVFSKSKNIDDNFEEIFFKYSIPYSKYDDLESQLKIFFGRDLDRPENIFYPDISIIHNSDSLREIYRSKLNDMSISEIQYNDDK